MALFKKYNKLDVKLLIKITSVIIGVFGLLLTYYYAVIYDKSASIVYDIVSETNVLEIKEDVGYLKVLYRDVDLIESNLNMKIYNVRIINDGRGDILLIHYDENLNWGFEIIDGEIIEIQTISSNDKYLVDRINPIIYEGNRVSFERVIFESGKYISLRVVVLHDINYQPYINPLGKIAGVSEIEVIKSYLIVDKESLSEQLFSGTIWIQIGRMIG
jgi:hypothetical protein